MTGDGSAARPGSGRDRAAVPVLLRILVAVPDRLLLVLLWTCVVVDVALVLGVHRPRVVLPVVGVVLAVTWRWRPRAPRATTAAAVAVVACLGLLAAWVAVQLPLTGERLLVSRDPDVYTLTALWLIDHETPLIAVPPGSDGVLGFDVRQGSWHPQGNHLVPGMSALLGWPGGTTGVLRSGLLWGAAALLALFALARRLVGPAWALVPVAALALSLPLLDVSRVLYTEPLTMALSSLGAALLLDAWRSDRAGDLLLAGVALGSAVMARADALLGLVGLVAALTPVALSAPEGPGGARRWGSGLVALGAAPSVAVALLDLQRMTVGYWSSIRTEVLLLVGVGALAAAAATVVAAVSRARVLDAWRAWVPRVTVVLAVALVVVLVGLATRPLWLVTTGAGNAAVAAAQVHEGLPPDPGRTYHELTLAWLVWYWGPVSVVLGGIGLTAWLVLGLRSRGRGDLACLVLLVLPSALVYAWWPGITPDQVWAVRRFLPVVVPGLLVAAVWVLARGAAAGRRRAARRAVAVALAVGILAWPAATLPDLWSVRDKGGALAGVREVCARLAGRPAVVTGVDTLAPTIRVVCDVPTLALTRPDPTTADLVAARRALGAGDVAVVTRDPDGITWRDDRPAPVEVVYTQWEATVTRRPQGPVTVGTLVTVATLDEAGDATR